MKIRLIGFALLSALNGYVTYQLWNALSAIFMSYNDSNRIPMEMELPQVILLFVKPEGACYN